MNDHNINSLNFEGLSLKLDTKENVKSIIETISSKPNAEVLNLSGNTLGIEAANAIGTALEKHQSINKCFFNDLFTGRLKTEIAPALKGLSAGLMLSGAKLNELDLSDNAFGPNGVVGVEELLASAACSSLQILRMNNQGLGHEGCRHLVNALKKGRQMSQNKGLLLKVFSAGRNRLENVGASLLSEVFTQVESLEELSLYQNGIGIHGIDGVMSLVNIIKCNLQLRVLNLSDNSLTPKGAEKIAAALPSLKNLEELHLSDCILRCAGTTYLSNVLENKETTPGLRVLNLTGNEIRTTAGLCLVSSLANKSKLELLDLNANEFGTHGIRAIIKTLRSIGKLDILPTQQNSTDDLAEADNYELAFDEDMGSDDQKDIDFEDEEDEEEEEDVVEQYSEDEDDREEEEEEEEDVDEQYSENEDDREEEEEEDSSYEKVDQNEVTNFGKPFSFRAFQEEIGQNKYFNVQNTTPNNKQKSLGLFSDLSLKVTGGSEEKGKTPSKLWGSNVGNLFSNQSATDTKFGLFGSPILNKVLTNSNLPPVVTSLNKVDDTKLNELLIAALKAPRNDWIVIPLIDYLKTCEPVNQQTIYPMLTRCTEANFSENVVRLSLRLSVKANPERNDALVDFALGLIACIFTQYPLSDKFGCECRSRAVNCLLIYLDAIKAEKGSEDWIYLKTLSSKKLLDSELAVYFKLIKQLIHRYGPHLYPSVSNCLTLLLSERNRIDECKTKSLMSSNPLSYETKASLSDLVQILDQQLKSIKLSS